MGYGVAIADLQVHLFKEFEMARMTPASISEVMQFGIQGYPESAKIEYIVSGSIVSIERLAESAYRVSVKNLDGETSRVRLCDDINVAAELFIVTAHAGIASFNLGKDQEQFESKFQHTCEKRVCESVKERILSSAIEWEKQGRMLLKGASDLREKAEQL
ncbi:MAG: hypothetical protein CMJ19_22030 [Phycisphaeraceae bacterium]|nr:hypothetical protein [Phycisphaeraceae bacterium]